MSSRFLHGDSRLPVRAHIWKSQLSGTHHYPGTKCSNAWEYGRHFIFKLKHVETDVCASLADSELWVTTVCMVTLHIWQCVSRLLGPRGVQRVAGGFSSHSSLWDVHCLWSLLMALNQEEIFPNSHQSSPPGAWLQPGSFSVSCRGFPKRQCWRASLTHCTQGC